METKEGATTEITEKSRPKPAIKFVPGEHHWILETENDYFEDPYHAFNWPEGVRKRLQNTEFDILTLDSLSVNFADGVSSGQDLKTGSYDSDNTYPFNANELKDHVWMYMPGSPKMLGKDRIRLLAGDIALTPTSADTTETVIREALEHPEQLKVRQLEKDILNDPEQPKRIARAASAVVSIPVALQQLNELRQKKISRRSFLKLAGAAAFSAVVNAAANKGKVTEMIFSRAGSTGSETEQEMLEAVINAVIDEDIETPNLIHLRNAVMYDKTQDAIDMGLVEDDESAAILAGSFHIYNWDEIEDPEKRQDISAYYKKYLEDAVPEAVRIAAEWGGKEYDDGIVQELSDITMRSVIRDITHFGIIEVREPERSDDPDVMTENIRSSISTQGIYESPTIAKAFA